MFKFALEPLGNVHFQNFVAWIQSHLSTQFVQMVSVYSSTKHTFVFLVGQSPLLWGHWGGIVPGSHGMLLHHCHWVPILYDFVKFLQSQEA